MSGVFKVDAWEKVAGQAVFAGDIKLPDMLYAVILRSEVPHARIRGVDVAAALEVPGVAAVITGRDFTDALTGITLRDEVVMARDKVRYIGEPVAAVAACDRATARRALGLIRVDMEELPALLTVEEAMAEGAPLVHENAEDYQSRVPLVRHGNVVSHTTVDKGNVEEAFATCDVIVEDTFNLPLVHHAPLEPKAAVARVDAAGRLTVWCGTQASFNVRAGLSAVTGLPMARIRVVGVRIGGGFGQKSWATAVEASAALLALKTRRPVKVEMSRQDDFYAANPRHAMKVQVKTGARKGGTIVAKEARLWLDTGAYANFGPMAASYATTLVTGPYRIPNLHIESVCVYTNKVSCGACRAPAAPQAHFTAEIHMDKIARSLSLDPLALRKKNAMEAGDTTATGQVLADWGYTAVLDRLEEAVAQELQTIPVTPGRRRGIGIAGGFWGMAGYASSCTVRVEEDGSVVLNVGSVETGAGSDTAMAILAGAELGVPPERVRVVSGDTDACPYDMGAIGSRTTQAMGTVVVQAARRVRDRLVEEAAELLHVPAAELEVGGGRIYSAGQPGRSVTLGQIASYVSFVRGGPVLEAGSNSKGPSGHDQDHVKGHVVPASPFFCFGAQGVAVDADEVTGRVDVLKIVAVHDLGKVVYTQGAEGQIQGGVAMGLGYGLSEEAVFEGGRVLNANFLDYRVPTMADVPRIEPVLLEKPSPRVPEDIRGIGEPPVVPTAAAIANAVFDALGVRVTSPPLTPERVSRAVRDGAARD